MNRKITPAIRLLTIVLTLSLLAMLGSCEYRRVRPDRETTETESDSSLPVGAETDGQAPKKRVAITFDDGPQLYNDLTKKYVDELDKYGFHATFFVVGNRIGGDAIAYAVKHGNEIGIHGYTHATGVYYDTCNDEKYEQEISKTVQAIQRQVPNYEINLMRPVGGRISPERANASPYSIILWSVDSNDWNGDHRYYAGISDEEAAARVQRTVDDVMTTVRDGDIILLHDIYESTYDATVIILERLYEEGYEVVTVSELLGDTLAPGIIYSSTYD